MTTAASRVAGRPSLRLLHGGQRPLRVAVLGGGIAGLASAHFLVKAGHRPVVLEASRRLGGLGTDFAHLGIALDRWHHVLRGSDAELMALIGELGLAGEVRWSETATGLLIDGRLYGFDSPVDLLHFGALSLPDRIRTGLGALYLGRLRRRGEDLDRVRAVDWLSRLFGARVVARLWDPLLRARFGDRCRDVPAYWVWNLLRREQGGSRDVKGSLRCGYRGIATALQATVIRGGGQVRLASPVSEVEDATDGVVVTTPAGGERFDAAVSTVPLPLLARAARGALAAQVPLPDLHYRGVVNAVVVSRSRLERFYRTAVVDARFPFHGVVETTHVMPPEWGEGRHVYHLTDYCDAASAAYARSDEVVAGQAVEGLTALYPHFRRRSVEAVYVFRASHVEPVFTLGYLARRPGPRVGRSRLYLCTTAQAYPRATSWNTSVALAAETVTRVLDDLARSGVAAA